MSPEPTADMRNQPLSAADIDRLTLRAAAAIVARTPKLAHHVRTLARPRAQPVELAGDVSTLEFVHLDDVVLPRRHFLRQLQRERRRVDRSKSPLSIALFHYAGAQADEFRSVAELLNFLRIAVRQTDILGDLGDGTIALMLPDTNSEGTQQFAKKITGRLNELNFTNTTATYPDDLFDGLLAGNDNLAQEHQRQLLIDRPKTPDELGLLIKRSIDVVSAATAIVLLSPLMFATATAIAVTSPGPIIYRQTRLGKGGVPFTFYKFRSMGCKLDDGVHREYVIGLIREGQGRDGDRNTPRPWAKLASDSRITPVGRFIRRTSIDELPQLFNVLKGDLSLIGPRPALPYEAENYQSWHLRRILEVKPGVSGLWQVAAGPNTTFNDMVRLDLQYMSSWSLMLDLKIMIKTVLVVLRRPGAG